MSSDPTRAPTPPHTRARSPTPGPNSDQVYGSIALLRPADAAAPTLSKTRMAVRATPIGVTTSDIATAAPFWTWAFSRNPTHCARLRGVLDGCTVVADEHVPRGGHLTYCGAPARGNRAVHPRSAMPPQPPCELEPPPTPCAPARPRAAPLLRGVQSACT